MSQEHHVVVLGGGNGTSHVLRALLPFLRSGKVASLHALVQMADDGGSTGRLRRQYGVAAVGDLTRCLLALSGWSGDVRGEAFLRALEYRFEGGDFDGHTLRNIFLTALEKSSGTGLDSALATMARVLNVPKNTGVVPTTLTTLTEQVEISINGSRNVLGVGQHFISHHVNLQADPTWKPGDVRVVFKEGDVPLNPRAQLVLSRATHIVVAPGHTYGSILPTLALPALARAVSARRAVCWIVTPLLTTPQHTSGWRGEDFVVLYQSYMDRVIDAVIANTGTVPIPSVPRQEWIRFSGDAHDYRLLEADVVSREAVSQQRTDTVPRAVVVHDGVKLEALLKRLLS